MCSRSSCAHGSDQSRIAQVMGKTAGRFDWVKQQTGRDLKEMQAECLYWLTVLVSVAWVEAGYPPKKALPGQLLVIGSM